jgi:hypothetical protein
VIEGLPLPPIFLARSAPARDLRETLDGEPATAITAAA